MSLRLRANGEMNQSQILIAEMSKADGDVTPICIAASNWNELLSESLRGKENIDEEVQVFSSRSRYSLPSSKGDVGQPVEGHRGGAFDYIEMFYNPKRHHGSNGDVSPVEFKARNAPSSS